MKDCCSTIETEKWAKTSTHTKRPHWNMDRNWVQMSIKFARSFSGTESVSNLCFNSIQFKLHRVFSFHSNLQDQFRISQPENFHSTGKLIKSHWKINENHVFITKWKKERERAKNHQCGLISGKIYLPEKTFILIESNWLTYNR